MTGRHVDIERHDELLRYLRDSGRIGPDERPEVHTLAGGVSNRTVLVQRQSGEAWVLKQALPKLRVPVEWYCSPERIQREALALHWLAELAPTGTITPLVFEDRELHLLAMEAVPQPHENWKTMLLSGRLDLAHVRQFGTPAAHHPPQCAQTSGRDRARLRRPLILRSPAARALLRVHGNPRPRGSAFLARLVEETLARRDTLVHGDYSPKNVLVRNGRLVLLDHEVAHFGDPGFDLGFSLAHLLSKAHHLPHQRADFASAALVYWKAYDGDAELEPRVVRHTLGCLLARVAGRSPLEYLDEHERAQQQARGARPVDPAAETVGRARRSVPGGALSTGRGQATAAGHGLTARSHREDHPSHRARDPGQPRPPHRPSNLPARERRRRNVSVPSGASTGTAEAHELRDGDPNRYGGLGCRKAVAGIEDGVEQRALGPRDRDPGATRPRAGGARRDGEQVAARRQRDPRRLTRLRARDGSRTRPAPLRPPRRAHAGAPQTLPRPEINLFSGGRHAGGQVVLQDVLVIPTAAHTIDEALTTVSDVYRTAASLVLDRYGMRELTADEGGLAPPFPTVEQMLADAARGSPPEAPVALSIDVAASQFYARGHYVLDEPRSAQRAMVERLLDWIRRYPIVAVEDGLAEDDWESVDRLPRRRSRQGADRRRRPPLHQPGPDPTRHR